MTYEAIWWMTLWDATTSVFSILAMAFGLSLIVACLRRIYLKVQKTVTLWLYALNVRRNIKKMKNKENPHLYREMTTNVIATSGNYAFTNFNTDMAPVVPREVPEYRIISIEFTGISKKWSANSYVMYSGGWNTTGVSVGTPSAQKTDKEITGHVYVAVDGDVQRVLNMPFTVDATLNDPGAVFDAIRSIIDKKIFDYIELADLQVAIADFIDPMEDYEE